MWLLFSCALLQSPNSSGISFLSVEIRLNLPQKISKRVQSFISPGSLSQGLTFSSSYSNILVLRTKGSVRSLYFIRDSGEYSSGDRC